MPRTGTNAVDQRPTVTRCCNLSAKYKWIAHIILYIIQQTRRCFCRRRFMATDRLASSRESVTRSLPPDTGYTTYMFNIPSHHIRAAEDWLNFTIVKCVQVPNREYLYTSCTRPIYIRSPWLTRKRYNNLQVGTPRAADGLFVVHSPVNAPPPPSVIDAGRVK